MLKELVPYFAITALFVIPGIIGLIAVVSWFKSRNRLYQSIDDAVEKGASPEVIAQLVAITEPKEDKEAKTTKRKHLTDGAIMFALGIAFLVLYFLRVNMAMIYPGVFLTALGAANLFIGAFITKDKTPDGE